MNSQIKGVTGEINLVAVLNDLLQEFSTISSLRRYESGFQAGKDIKLEACIKKNNILGIVGPEKLRWFFEVKNYKTRLNPEKLLMKIHQVKSSNLSIDCFCLFSPYENVNGLFEDSLTNPKVLDMPEYPFRIVLWTPSNQIKERLKCFPEIFEKIYNEKSTIDEQEKNKLLEIWRKEIPEKTEEGKKIKETYIEKFKGGKPLWVPESVQEAKDIIAKVDGSLLNDEKKKGVVERKLKYGGVTSHQDILQAKIVRVKSEGTRRKYKKINEDMFRRLCALRQELECFCLELEKDILEKQPTNEAIVFLNEFFKKIEEFKKIYHDKDLVQILPTSYLKGQMFDITGECILSLSKKWLEEFKKIGDKNK